MFHLKKVEKIFLLILVACSGVLSIDTVPVKKNLLTFNMSCSTVKAARKEARELYFIRQAYERKLQSVGFLGTSFQNPPLPKELTELYEKSNIVLETTKVISQILPNNRIGSSRASAKFYEKLSKCLAKNCESTRDFKCSNNREYRPFDGSCTSFEDVSQGVANTAYSRLIGASYDDHVNEFRKSVTGNDLPLPRKIVTSLFLDQKLLNASTVNLIPNSGSILFGQLITHDVGSKQHVQPSSGGADFHCCSKSGHSKLPKQYLSTACCPARIPGDDLFYSNFSVTCLNIIRSQTVTPSGCPTLGAAQQINAVTSYLDLSVIYGSSRSTCNSLRTFEDGQLKMNKLNFMSEEPGCTATGCYRAGDPRVNQTPFLAIWHVLFYREHNRIAKILRDLNSFWSEENVFQETRKIVIASYQHVIYNEYLPAYLSARNIQEFGLSTHAVDFKTNTHVDSRTTNEFSHGIFRRFHNLSPTSFDVLDKNNKLLQSLKIVDVLSKSKMMETSYNEMIRGMLIQTMNTKTVNVDYASKLFQNSDGFGLDLLTIDLIRGRDHGLAPYYVYRENCGLPPVKTFDDLFPSISKNNIKILQTLYESVFDIDLEVGAGLEELNGEVLGPTVQCIISVQFYRYKYGDQHYYSNDHGKLPFTNSQLKEIKKYTLGKLICDNSDLEEVPRNSFISPSAGNPMTKCKDIESINLEYWADDEDAHEAYWHSKNLDSFLESLTEE